MKHLVIVESPTKARTLRQYLGPDFIVESSIGHIRDLPASASEIPASLKGESWARLGVDVDDDFRPLYVVQPAKRNKIRELRQLLGEVDELLLATDEDREGEAISWHLIEVLKPKVPVRRMVFHEITRQAIEESLHSTRAIDQGLVEAQEARRIIDRLYGYMVSPILWRKIAPRLSAGRVQSVAIRMLVERERARMRFRPAEYWDLVAELTTGRGESFEARLVSVDGRRIATGKDFDPTSGRLQDDRLLLLDDAAAAGLRARLEEGTFRVASVEEQPFTRAPSPPFTTSTLQQEANRKLRFNARRTMRAAQRLYETGLITYMRTDSVTLSSEALRMTRAGVERIYGADYLPSEPRTYRTKVKNAQEAHEAIRPAGTQIADPAAVRRQLGEDEAKLYDLIWKRTMACQMKDARGRRMQVRVRAEAGGRDARSAVAGAEAGGQEAIFQAGGSVIDFAGFLRAYVEGREDPEAALADLDRILPEVTEGERLEARLQADEHHTTAPPRLSEAALIRALEESGIGRPSTYASIIDTIQRREYTFKKGNALVPTFMAFAVVQLMEDHLEHLIDTEFTARMENRLDRISRGERDPLPYLREFYFGDGMPGLKQILDHKVEEISPRDVCSIPIGTDEEGRGIIVRVGRYGPFLQRGETTATLRDGICPDELTVAEATRLLEASAKGGEPLGEHPETGEPVYAKVGRYGPYVQLGDGGTDPKTKPKMVSLLKGMEPAELTLEVALELLSLPRAIARDEAGEDIVLAIGRYGPYIKRGDDTRSLGPDDDPLSLTRERALELLAEEKRGFRRTPKELLVFAKVDALGGGDVRVLDGRYGPYVTDGEVNASLPAGADPAALTIEAALELLAAKRAAGAGGGGRKKKARTRKKAAGKAPRTTSGKKTSRKKVSRKKKPSA